MFRPTLPQLVLLRDLASQRLAELPREELVTKNGRALSTADVQAKAYFYAAVTLFNHLGALDKDWKKKNGL